jgi:hypothetical protein
MRWWDEGWADVFGALEPLRPGDLTRSVTIRGEPLSVLQAISRQVDHYAYHVGQIVVLAMHWKSAAWKTLSVPRGKSEEFRAHKVKRHPPK